MQHSFGKLPQNPGIYLFKDQAGKIIYIGKAKNLKKRVSSYFLRTKDLGEKTRALIEKIKSIETISTTSEIESYLLEANLIKKHLPYYNIRLADDKFYPYVRITRDKYPKVLITRSKKDKKSDYFGPYPNASSLKLLLKTIRRIFPFQSVINHDKKVCLYNHLGLCPCPYVFDSKEMRIEYSKNIRRIKAFLNGKIKDVRQELEKERDEYTLHENFEKAAKIQRKIGIIELVTKPVSRPEEYDENPNLRRDILSSQTKALEEALIANGVEVARLDRIECFDISNTSGKDSTGSMIVFTNGDKDTSSYRRFKIKLTYPGPNDFLMMQEVLRRRLKNDWPLPGLFVVDGGKGQVSSASKILKEMGLMIPLIGLAKREETIITEDLRQVSLPRNSEALKLLMRIRDEAHRFAITYHRKLRRNQFLSSS